MTSYNAIYDLNETNKSITNVLFPYLIKAQFFDGDCTSFNPEQEFNPNEWKLPMKVTNLDPIS